MNSCIPVVNTINKTKVFCQMNKEAKFLSKILYVLLYSRGAIINHAEYLFQAEQNKNISDNLQWQSALKICTDNLH